MKLTLSGVAAAAFALSACAAPGPDSVLLNGTGALADLAVLSADLFTAPVRDLPAMKSVLTLVGGRIAHDSGVVGR